MDTRIARRLTCLLLAIICLAPAVVLCQSKAWEPIGPHGGNVAPLAQDPSNSNILYAAISEMPSRIYKSTDHGQSWSNVWSANGYLIEFLFDPTNPSSVYAYSTYTLYKSLDAGRTWTSTPLAPDAATFAFRIDPADPSIWHAAGMTLIGSGWWRGAYFRSSNGGLTWTKIISTDTGSFRSIAIDPANSQTVFVGGHIWNSGLLKAMIYKSTDGGKTFTEMPVPAVGGANKILLHPTLPGRMYVSGLYVCVSSDGGSTWTPCNGAGNYIEKLVINKDAPLVVYAASDAAIRRSTDGGTTWTTVAGDLNNGFGGMIVEQGSTPCIFYANAAGVIRSLDGGTNWEPCNTGISAAHIRALCIPATTPATMYASFEYSTVYKTIGALSTSVSWQQLKRFYTCKYICAMGSPPGKPEKIYAGEGGA